jgi:hypothetical protein
MSITMPSTPGFISSKFGLETNTQTFSSPLTKNVQRLLLGGARWTASYTLPKMKRERAAAWQAFFLSLDGGLNTFNAFDPDAKQPRGIATGTPLVNGANQTGNTLVIDGCTASVFGWLRAGDYVSVNGELKMATADCNTDGSGNATISFKPAIRNSPSDNSAVTVRNATCTMVLADDNQAMWDTDMNSIYQDKTFTAYEVF